MSRITGMVLFVLGLGAVVLGATAFVRATPMRFRCDRAALRCVWQQPRLLGGTHDTTVALVALRDSRVERDASKSGLSTRWIVSSAEGDLELGPATLNTDEGETYERLARELQQFLGSQRAVFDAEVVTSARRWWLILALAGAFVLAWGLLLSRGGGGAARAR